MRKVLAAGVTNSPRNFVSTAILSAAHLCACRVCWRKRLQDWLIPNSDAWPGILRLLAVSHSARGGIVGASPSSRSDRFGLRPQFSPQLMARLPRSGLFARPARASTSQRSASLSEKPALTCTPPSNSLRVTQADVFLAHPARSSPCRLRHSAHDAPHRLVLRQHLHVTMLRCRLPSVAIGCGRPSVASLLGAHDPDIHSLPANQKTMLSTIAPADPRRATSRLGCSSRRQHAGNRRACRRCGRWRCGVVGNRCSCCLHHARASS